MIVTIEERMGETISLQVPHSRANSVLYLVGLCVSNFWRRRTISYDIARMNLIALSVCPIL